MQANSCLYSQWFPGEDNNVADCLSRTFHLQDHTLSSRLLSLYPKQLPNGISIKPLPNEITSWLISQVQQQRAQMPSPMKPPKAKIIPSQDGSNSSAALDSTTTFSLTPCTGKNGFGSLPASLKQCERADSFQIGTHNSHVDPSRRPLASYLRSLGHTVGRTPPSMMTGNLPSFFIVNSGDTQMGIQEKNNSKQSPPPHSKMCQLAGSNHIDQAMSQLLIGGFYFATRSCEICDVTGDRRMKILTLGNL